MENGEKEEDGEKRHDEDDEEGPRVSFCDRACLLSGNSRVLHSPNVFWGNPEARTPVGVPKRVSLHTGCLIVDRNPNLGMSDRRTQRPTFVSCFYASSVFERRLEAK